MKVDLFGSRKGYECGRMEVKRNRKIGIAVFTSAAFLLAALFGFWVFIAHLPSYGTTLVNYDQLAAWKESVKKQYQWVRHISTYENFEGDIHFEFTCSQTDEESCALVMEKAQAFIGQYDFLANWYHAQGKNLPQSGFVPSLTVNITNLAGKSAFSSSSGRAANGEPKEFGQLYGYDGKEAIYFNWSR